MTRTPVLFALLALFALETAAFPYSAAPISGTVVDADTGEPLEGVNVVAQWAMEEPRSRRYAGDLELMEAVTDGRGAFHFPAWGPKDAPPDAYPGQRLDQELDPVIMFFKSGYRRDAFRNEFGPPPMDIFDRGATLRTSRWDGKTIKLKKFNGPVKEYALMVSLTFGGLSLQKCEWKKIPRAIVTLTREKERLAKQGVYSGPITVDRLYGEAKEECGDVRRFFEEYLK